MCVQRGDGWLLEERAPDGAICPLGWKIKKGPMQGDIGPVTIYTETASEAVARESREELESTDEIASKKTQNLKMTFLPLAPPLSSSFSVLARPSVHSRYSSPFPSRLGHVCPPFSRISLMRQPPMVVGGGVASSPSPPRFPLFHFVCDNTVARRHVFCF